MTKLYFITNRFNLSCKYPFYKWVGWLSPATSELFNIISRVFLNNLDDTLAVKATFFNDLIRPKNKRKITHGKYGLLPRFHSNQLSDTRKMKT